MTDQPEQGVEPVRPRRRYVRIVVIAVILAGLAVASYFLPVKDYVIDALEWTKELGFWGPFFVAAFYILACVLLFPGGIITLAAGFLFGVVIGTITVSIGSTLGACAAFMVGRTFARDWVEKKVAGHPRFKAIDQAVEEQGSSGQLSLLDRIPKSFSSMMQSDLNVEPQIEIVSKIEPEGDRVGGVLQECVREGNEPTAQ